MQLLLRLFVAVSVKMKDIGAILKECKQTVLEIFTPVRHSAVCCWFLLLCVSLVDNNLPMRWPVFGTQRGFIWPDPCAQNGATGSLKNVSFPH